MEVKYKIATLLIVLGILSVAFFYKFSKPAQSDTTHVVISEVQLGITGASTNEFIELYNPTDKEINVTGWRLAKKTAAADATEVFVIESFPEKTIPAHGYLLLAHDDYDGGKSEDVSYNADSFSNNNTLLLYNASLELVDKVGLGSSNDVETLAIGNPASGKSIERKAKDTSTAESMVAGGEDEFSGNGLDTDNNSTDFILRNVPEPQNIASNPENGLSPTLSPVPTEEPVATPTETTEPTPTDTHPIPTEIAEPTPTEIPDPAPTEELNPTPTVEPTNTPTLYPSPTPAAKNIAKLPFLRSTVECKLTYRIIHFAFLTFRFPRLSCL